MFSAYAGIVIYKFKLDFIIPDRVLYRKFKPLVRNCKTEHFSGNKQQDKFKKTSTYFSLEHVVLTRNGLAIKQILLQKQKY